MATLYNQVVSGAGSASFTAGFLYDVFVHVVTLPTTTRRTYQDTDSLFKAGWICLGNNLTLPTDGVARDYWYDKLWINWENWGWHFVQTADGFWASRVRWRLATGMTARVFIGN